MSNRESRHLMVPEGLDGMRVDAALAKLLGISRTVAAELAQAGDVLGPSASLTGSPLTPGSTSLCPQPPNRCCPKPNPSKAWTSSTPTTTSSW